MPYESDVDTFEIGVSSAKVASFVAITQILAVITSGIMLVVVARLLGPSDYGIYTLAYGVAAFFGSFGLFGVAHYMNRYIPHLLTDNKKQELAETLGASIVLLLLICVAFFLLGVVFSGFIASYVFHNAAYEKLIIIALFSSTFTMLMGLEYNILIGFKDGVGCAITYTSGSASTAIISIALVLLGYGPLGAILGTILGSLVGVVVGNVMINKHSKIVINIDVLGKRIERVQHMLRFSVILSASSMVSTMLNNFAIIFLGAFSLPEVVGSFGVAYRIGMVIVTVITFIGSVLLQMFSSVLAKKGSLQGVGKLYNQSIYFGVLFAAPIAAYLVALSHAFVTSVFPSYTSAQFYIPLLSISLLLGIISAYASSVVISVGKVKKVLKYSALTAAVQLSLLILLVPFFDAYGIILGLYLSGSLVGNYLYVRYMRRVLHIETSLAKVYKVIAASVALAFLLFPINMLSVSQTAQLFIGVIAGAVLYPILLGVTNALGSAELKTLDSVARSTPALGGLLSFAVSYAALFVRRESAH